MCVRVGACDFSSALRGKLRLFLSEEYFTLYIVSFSFLYIQILICHLIPFFRYVFLSCSACFCDLIFVPQIPQSIFRRPYSFMPQILIRR